MNHCVSTRKICELFGVVSWTYQAKHEGCEWGRLELYYTLYYSQAKANNIYRIGVRESTGKIQEVR